MRVFTVPFGVEQEGIVREAVKVGEPGVVVGYAPERDTVNIVREFPEPGEQILVAVGKKFLIPFITDNVELGNFYAETGFAEVAHYVAERCTVRIAETPVRLQTDAVDETVPDETKFVDHVEDALALAGVNHAVVIIEEKCVRVSGAGHFKGFADVSNSAIRLVPG